MDKLGRKTAGQGAVRARKRFIWFISNEDMNDMVETIESLENSGQAINGASKTVKHKIKKQEGGFSYCYNSIYGCFVGSLNEHMDYSLMQPIVSSLIKAMTGKRS